MRNADWNNVFQCLFTVTVQFNVCSRFRFVLIDGNLTAQLTGSHRGIGDEIEIAEM